MVVLTIAIALVFLTVLYFYFKRKYFTLHGPIPGIPPQFLFGNLIQTGLITGDITSNVIFLDLKSKFGDVFQYWLGPSRIVVVSRLEDIEHIFANRHIYDQGELFTDKLGLIIPYGLLVLKGPIYKRHYGIIAPLFRRNKFNTHLETIYDCTDKLLMRWRNSYQDPTKVHLNIIEQCQQLLLAIFGYVAFDYDLQTLDDENNSNKNELTKAFHDHFYAAAVCIQLPIILGRLYLLLSPGHRRSTATINRYLEQMIEQELRQTPETRAQRKRTSLIASLIDSLEIDENLEQTKSEENKKGFSREEVIGEMIFFLDAGFGTTTASLAWLIFHLSKHPNVQTKLKKELFEYGQQRLTIEQLDSLVYLDCVIRESLRLTPPDPGTVRTLLADDQLPSTGAFLKKGDQVMIPFYNLNRDERYCIGSTDPTEFHPERFLVENNDNTKKLVPMTFGAGHRQCIGQDFVKLELKVICARLMQHVTFGDGGNVLNAGGYKQIDTIMPRHIGVTITFD